jgi:ATP-binding cassette, subfamily B, heavy metal transporter
MAVALVILDAWLAHKRPTPKRRLSLQKAAANKTPSLSWETWGHLLKPYFWPDATNTTALWNRVCAIATWFCVVSSKACGLVAPLMLGKAATALAHQDYRDCIKFSILHAMFTFMASTFKEGQSLVYLSVAQAAFVQLSETAFDHLHHLSLDWHLRKKLGEVRQ